MAPENGSPVGASPENCNPLAEVFADASDSWEDLLGAQIPIEDCEKHMVDFPEEATHTPQTPPVAVMVDPQSSKNPVTDMDAVDESAKPIVAMKNTDAHTEISDTGHLHHLDKHDTKISDGVADISDKEDPQETIVLEDRSASAPMKKEQDDVEFLWSRMDDRVIELDSDSEPSANSKPNLGTSFLKGLDPTRKPRSVDPSDMRRAQEAYLQAHRRKLGLPETSAPQKVLDGVGPQEPVRSEIPVDHDSAARMNSVSTPEEDTGKRFRSLCKSYKAKVKKDINTMHDDMEFAKAEKAENLRLARLKAEFNAARGYSDDEDTDDGMFVSSSPAKTSRAKKRAADPDAENEDSVSRDPKRRKPNAQGKRSQEELDEDKIANMLAGIDMYLTKKKYAPESEVEDPAEQGQATSSKPSKSSKGKKSRSTKSNHKGKCHRNDIGNMMTSNVFDDATANNDRDALPVSSETDKRKAMNGILACVPLKNIQEARDDKAAILKASVTLAPRKVTGDGHGGYKLQGMASSLLNHQLLAADFMRQRECGGQHPLGGILADGMVRFTHAGTICCRTTDPGMGLGARQDRRDLSYYGRQSAVSQRKA